MEQANNLSHRKTVAFAAALCERMLPNYSLFCEVVGFSGGPEIKKVMDLVWEWVYVKNAKIDFEKQLEKLEIVTPDPSEFDMYGVYPALNCCVALATTIHLICGDSLDLLSEVIAVSQGTISSFIDAGGIENGTPLMEEELLFKEAVMEILNSGDTVSPELRMLAKNEGVSNLGISLA